MVILVVVIVEYEWNRVLITLLLSSGSKPTIPEFHGVKEPNVKKNPYTSFYILFHCMLCVLVSL